jgi:hypothetical protein
LKSSRVIAVLGSRSIALKLRESLLDQLLNLWHSRQIALMRFDLVPKLGG